MTLATNLKLDPLSPDLTSLLLSLPENYGVYAIRSQAEMLHLGWTVNLRRRLTRLLRPDRPSSLQLSRQIGGHGAVIECWPTGSSLETSLQTYLLALEFFPKDYPRRLHLRSPWFVALTDDRFPRLNVTNRPPSSAAPVLGPFANRDLAARFEESVLQLFQIRRCTELLQPQPDHPGCIYGEMSLCMRPCQLHVSTDEYATEASRVRSFLEAGPANTIASLALARDQAVQQLDFEWASQLHKQIDRVSATQSARPDIVTDLNDFQGVAVTPGIAPRSYCLRAMSAGRWLRPVTLQLADTAVTVSLDSRVRELLSLNIARDTCPGTAAEHLAIFSRWYHSHSRSGEWFAYTLREGIPYRKISRGISRLAKALAPVT